MDFAEPPEVEQAEQRFYLDCLRPGMVTFDVGANIGEMCLFFSRLVGPGGSVFGFEPAAGTFGRLAQLSKLVGRQNIILHNVAVGQQEGSAELYVFDEAHSGWNSLADRPLAKYGIDLRPSHIERVEMVTVDGFCRRNAIERIDLLKIDVEGRTVPGASGSP